MVLSQNKNLSVAEKNLVFFKYKWLVSVWYQHIFLFNVFSSSRKTSWEFNVFLLIKADPLSFLLSV